MRGCGGGQLHEDGAGMPAGVPPCHGGARRSPREALAEETGEARLPTAKGGESVFIVRQWSHSGQAVFGAFFASDVARKVFV